MIKCIDLSQPFYELEGMKKTLYNVPIIKTILEDDRPYGKLLGEDFRIHMMEITFQSHFGTHVDAPSHFCKNGKTIDQIPFERFVGKGICISISKPEFGVISCHDLEEAGVSVRKGDILLLNTGWGDKYGTDEYFRHPSLGVDAAEWLVKKKVSILGLDFPTPDIAESLRDKDFDYPVHKALLANEILIIENLANLNTIAGTIVTIASFPLKIKGADGSPARVFAIEGKFKKLT